MSFRGDSRGQSVQIGAVLLFATIIIALSLYQATVVPSQNQSIEYDAYQDASADMTSLRNAMLATAAGDGTRGVTVKTGAKYPSRVFLLNPLQPSGTVETTAPENLTLGNVNASNGELANVGTYFGTEDNALNYTTRNVRFDPDYNELSAADVLVANGFVYRNHSSPTPLAAQTLVRGNTISVQTVVGDLDADGYRSPVTATAVSAHTNTVSVTNESSGPLTLTVPTTLSASDWEDRVLAGQTSQNVQGVQPGPRPNTVTVELKPGETYELELSRIELHERDDSAVDDPDARYLVTEQDRKLRTNSDGRVKLVVQTRDAFNNPVSNQQVNFTSTQGKFETLSGDQLAASPTVRSNENGNAVVYYNATDDVGTLPVTARLGTGESVSAEKRVQYTITNTVTSGSGGSGGGGGSTVNPGNFVVLSSAQEYDAGGGTDRRRVRMTLRNDGQSDANVTAVRFPFYYEDDNNVRITDADLYDDSGNSLLNLPVRGTFKPIPGTQTINAGGGTRTYQFAFDGQNGDYRPDNQNDFFIVEVVYNDAYEATYFVNFES